MSLVTPMSPTMMVAGLAGIVPVDKAFIFKAAGIVSLKHQLEDKDTTERHAKRAKRSEITTSASKAAFHSRKYQYACRPKGLRHSRQNLTKSQRRAYGDLPFQHPENGYVPSYVPCPSPSHVQSMMLGARRIHAFDPRMTESWAMRRMGDIATAKNSWICRVFGDLVETSAPIWMALAAAAERKGAEAVSLEEIFDAYGHVSAQLKLIPRPPLTQELLHEILAEMAGLVLLKVEADGRFRVHRDLLRLVMEDRDIERLVLACARL
ncbi:hypothetical protein HDU96_007461 [Phlyctochytrium bullatum]|nr:hypothetical protein HDU96_007461 [Phlyctochytrium bullatum]